MNELSKNLKCLSIRNGAEIWLEDDRVQNLALVLRGLKEHKFIELPSSEFINTADLVGVFLPNTMENITRRKNGQWHADCGKWHDKGDIHLPNGEYQTRDGMIKQCKNL